MQMTQDNPTAVARSLRAMIQAHDELLAAVVAHRDALARADREAIAGAMGDQERTLARIRSLDQTRRETFGDATVQDLAADMQGEARAETLELGARLRSLIEKIRAEQAVVAAASRTLLGHMEGLFRQVAARLSHAGTYGRLGSVEPGKQVVSGIDLTR